jgi:hypothetical protein
MFKKFVIGFLAALMVAQPALAGKFGGGSFSSSRSFSSGSSFRSSGFSSESSYHPSTSYQSSYRPSSSYSRPDVTQPRFSSGPSYNTAKPAQTRVVSRPNSSYYSGGYNRAPVNNHYYGSGYSGGGGFVSSFGGAFTGSMLGNMLFDNHNQTPVYVNNGGGYAPGPVQGDGGYAPGPVVDNGPGFFGMIFWGFVNLLTLIAIVAAIIWIFRKVRTYFQGN